MTSGLEEYFIDDAPDDKPEPGFRLRRLIPNFITICGLSAGLLSIQKGVIEQWDQAVLLIALAAILDTMDGALARLLNATSKFGAELDSLSDFLCFGVAPAILVYLWILDSAGPIGWIAVLAVSIACALRLARFNTMSDVDPRPEWGRKFFMGVPAPCGAGLVLMPMIIHLQFPEFSALSALTPLIGIWMIVVAGLMVSKLPTVSSKQFKLPNTSLISLLAMGGLVLAAFIHAPWITLGVIGFAYMGSFPFVWRHHRKLQKQHADDPIKEALSGNVTKIDV